MKMMTYVVRRVLLVIPVLIGVVTITFLLFEALPVQDQLIAHYGAPSPHEPCGYSPTCECAQQDPLSVHDGTCECLDPDFNTTPQGICQNAIYAFYVHKLGLDKPVILQWSTYIFRSFTFQWGYISNHSAVGQRFSVFQGQTVATSLSWCLPYTLELAIMALLLILAISIPLGNASAVNRNRPIDQFSRVMSFSGFALPTFLLGSFVVAGVTLLLMPHVGSNFSVSTPWCKAGEAINDEFTYSWPQGLQCYPGLGFGHLHPDWMANGIQTHPTGFPTVDAFINGAPWLGLDSLIRLILPALVIAYGSIAGLLRFVRNSMLEVMNLDYVRTARAKGVPEHIVTSRHAGRNSLNVTITVLGLTFAGFVGGFPVIESVFGLTGVGEMLAIAANPQPALDFGLIFGSTLLFTFLVVAANIIVDILYAFLDPRVRLG
jgi:peptide/nickel transport system permease protein